MALSLRQTLGRQLGSGKGVADVEAKETAMTAAVAATIPKNQAMMRREMSLRLRRQRVQMISAV